MWVPLVVLRDVSFIEKWPLRSTCLNPYLVTVNILQHISSHNETVL